MADALLKRKDYGQEFEEDPLDDYYDVKIAMPSSGELDFLYTSDIHAAWKDYGGNRFGDGTHKIFSLATDQVTNTSKTGGDVKAYQERLQSNGIPTYLLDCGDWSLGGVSSTTANTISTLKSMNYFGVTIGNWEFKHGSDMSTNITQIEKMNGYGLMACNFRDSGNKVKYKGGKLGQNTTWVNSNNDTVTGSIIEKLVYQNNIPLSADVGTFNAAGLKTLKVGNKKIAVIGVGYCSPNGYLGGRIPEGGSGTGTEWAAGTNRWNYKTSSGTYTRHYDSVGTSGSIASFPPASSGALAKQKAGTAPYAYGGCVYREVQYLIDFFHYYNFDYIIVFGHMDKYSDESWVSDDITVDSVKYPRVYTRADFMIRNTSGINVLIPGHLNFTVNEINIVNWRNGNGSGIIAPEAGGEMASFGRLKLDLVSNTITCRVLQTVDDLTKVDITQIAAPTIHTVTY